MKNKDIIRKIIAENMQNNSMWLTERNIRTVVEDSNANGLQKLIEGQNRKFKELDTF